MADKTMLCPRCWGSQFEPVQGPDNTWSYTTGRCLLCTGAGTQPDQQLSGHFWLSDCLKSDTAVRNCIPNDPTSIIVDRLKRVLGLAEQIVSGFCPLHISSGYRGIWLNRKLDSKDTSAHMLGYALDLEPGYPYGRKALMDWIISSGLKYDQVIYEGVWVHLGLYRTADSSEQRQEARMAFGGKYPFYNPGDPRVV